MFSFYFLVVDSTDKIKVVRGDPTDPVDMYSVDMKKSMR